MHIPPNHHQALTLPIDNFIIGTHFQKYHDVDQRFEMCLWLENMIKITSCGCAQNVLNKYS
jgi:hypothetical protein